MPAVWLDVFLQSPSANCIRVSRSFRLLASDSQVWKEKYYERWVLPRFLRTPGLRDAENISLGLQYSSRRARWLDDAHLVTPGRKTDWHKQYRLKHNWNRGQCRTRRAEIGHRDEFRMLSQIYGGFIFTAHAVHGIRVWETKEGPSVISSMPIDPPKPRDPHSPSEDGCRPSYPQSLSIDPLPSGAVNLVVGFNCGTFRVYKFTNDALTLEYDGKQGTRSCEEITMLGSYILALSIPPFTDGELSLLRFPSDCHQPAQLPDPKPLMSAWGCNSWLPVSISLRSAAGGVIAAVTYFCNNILGPQLICIQEVRITEDGEVEQSRLAFSAGLGRESGSNLDAADLIYSSLRDSSTKFVETRGSVVYSHPYLLARLTDNTMIAYLVTSTPEKLEIGPGRRLWGHTSRVTSIRLNDRGKAVSSTLCGEDIRLWDLENILSAPDGRGRPSLCIRFPSYNPISCSYKQLAYEDRMTFCEWIGFDNEQIVTLCVDIDYYYRESAFRYIMNDDSEYSWVKISGTKPKSIGFWSCYDFT